jgi:nucleobase:cation symporter-1, NCS1 family
MPAYGANIVAVEPHGLEAIDASERHGRPRNLFALWFGANAEIATFALGIVAVALYGTSLPGVLIGLTIGNVLAYAIVGLTSLSGPRFGLPQMVVSRLAFGRDGNVVPAVLAFLSGVGWFAVDTALGAQALGALAHLSYPLSLGILLIAQTLIAVYGHNAIHAFERLASILSLVGFVVIGAVILAHGLVPSSYDARAPFAVGEWGGIVFAAALAFSYAVGWSPCASDYARYLPSDARPRSIIFWVFFGGILPSMTLEALGAAAVSVIHAPGLASATPTETIRLLANGNQLVSLVGLLTVLVGTLSANVINLYSGSLAALVSYDARRRIGFACAQALLFGGLTATVLLFAARSDQTMRLQPPAFLGVVLVVAGLSFIAVRWTLKRAQGAVIVGIVGGVVALAGADPANTARLFGNFLGMITMWVAPWAGVMLAMPLLSERNVRWPAIIAGLLGFCAGVPFWQQTWFIGPIAEHYPQIGDISFFVGFTVALVAAFGLRRLDQPCAARARK